MENGTERIWNTFGDYRNQERVFKGGNLSPLIIVLYKIPLTMEANAE